ncbi:MULTISPECIES: spike base protein, RCAP_Rcc01079 family [Alphaproteobacteria]|uniref:spike base protein, RCAP_Rcc01079 family n=1 Tax=Alphaproteobacteria TaxID=28211 RepID=UPI003A91F5D9
MSNPFQTGRALPLSGPAYDIAPVTPDDSLSLPVTAIGLYCETAGTIVCETAKGEIRTVAVGALSILPVGVTRVLETGTTASGIHALVLA